MLETIKRMVDLLSVFEGLLIESLQKGKIRLFQKSKLIRSPTMGIALHPYNTLFKRMNPAAGDISYTSMGKKAAIEILTSCFLRAVNSSIMTCATAFDLRHKFKSFRRSLVTLSDNINSQYQVEDIWAIY